MAMLINFTKLQLEVQMILVCLACTNCWFVRLVVLLEPCVAMYKPNVKLVLQIAIQCCIH